MKTLNVRGKELVLPAFFPDATLGVVKCVDSQDLENCGIDGVVVNTYHLFKRSLVSTIKEKGGIHNHMNFKRPIISDSGGFQVFSIIREGISKGEIRDDAIVFQIEDNKEFILTPENCIQTQISLGSDIIMCLDDCTRPESSLAEQEKSVARTIAWAKRCKAEFNNLTKDMNQRTLIFAIIQGGKHKELRKKCADELLKIGFDGYAFGGWPVNDKKEFLSDILKYVCELIPNNFPKYAMGVGKPENIAECVNMGYDMFDCVIPTREARNKRLYVFKNKPEEIKDFSKKFYSYLNLKYKLHMNNNKPLSEHCDCYTCKNYSTAYIYSLFKMRDSLAARLATIHNLRFYTQLIEALRKQN